EKLRNDIQALIAGVHQAGPPLGRPKLQKLVNSKAPIFSEVKVTPASTPGGLTRTLEVLAGAASLPIRANSSLWLGLFVVLLIILSLSGFYALYVKMPTFGSDAFFDYLGLFMWGLTADVTQRTLQTLPALR